MLKFSYIIIVEMEFLRSVSNKLNSSRFIIFVQCDVHVPFKPFLISSVVFELSTWFYFIFLHTGAGYFPRRGSFCTGQWMHHELTLSTNASCFCISLNSWPFFWTKNASAWVGAGYKLEYSVWLKYCFVWVWITSLQKVCCCMSYNSWNEQDFSIKFLFNLFLYSQKSLQKSPRRASQRAGWLTISEN